MKRFITAALAVIALSLGGIATTAGATQPTPDPTNEPDLAVCHSGDGNHWTYITPDANGYNGHQHHDADVFGLTEAECLAKNPVEPPTDPTPFVLIAWPMPGWVDSTTPTWPQGIAAGLTGPLTTDLATRNLGALDSTLAGIEANLACETSVQFQVDGNFDTQPVRDAIAGGSLYGPGNPAEALWGGGWGEAYKLVLLTGPVCEPEPTTAIPTDPLQKDKCAVADDHFGLPANTENVSYARSGLDIVATRIGVDAWGILPAGWVDNGDGTATFPFTAVTWTHENCPLPEEYDTYGEWQDGEFGCDDTEVSITRTVTHHHFANAEDGTVVETTEEGEADTDTRALTEEEITVCPTPEPTDPPVPPKKLGDTGVEPLIPFGIALLALLFGITASAIRRRA